MELRGTADLVRSLQRSFPVLSSALATGQ
uniref:Uncharacterized protein n=1 Tax=Arundo donax TaxID=35708 RepID=A0A0A8ZAS2_ARUDO